jgi:hypothetical protein
VRVRPPVVLLLAWALIALTWVFAKNPPFAAPDEGAHYVRAIGIGSDGLIGEKTDRVPYAPDAKGRAWLASTTRTVEIPRRLAPPEVACYILDPNRSAACVNRQPVNASPKSFRGPTYVGAFPPLPYLLPAAVVRLADRPAPALRLGRLASLALCLALLAVAVRALWDPRAGALSLLGLVAAVTPMVLFCAASLTGSGLEIVGVLALTATLLRVSRDARRPEEGDVPAWLWAAVGAAGVLLALSRPAGPAWAALILALWLALLGPRAVARIVRGRPAAWAAGGAIVIAVALNWLWRRDSGMRADFSLVNGRDALREGLSQFGDHAHDLVLGPGYLEYALPAWGSLLWLAIVVALVVAALVVARSVRERAVLVAVAIVTALLPIAFYALTVRFTGYGLQGRYVLPVAVALPLLAGELVAQHRDRLSAPAARALVVLVPAVAPLVQLLAGWRNAQRSAFGLDHPLVSWGTPAWTPPAGWALWFARRARRLRAAGRDRAAQRAGSSSATAMTATPSSRPTKPSLSPRVAFTLTRSAPVPSAAARRSRISSLCGARRGCSITTVASTFATRQPLSASRAAVARRRPSESASRQRSSESGKWVPMSSSAAAPSSASMTAWVSASASECPSRPRGWSMSTPPSTSRRPSAKRWTS